MLIQAGLFVLGLAALVAGAESLVRGASRLALSFGLSPLVVGLTVVAFGTSAPEMAVSVGSALKGQADIAVGNVVGSNIFNVLFILGVSALIAPLVVNAQVVRQEVPIMIGASVLMLVFAASGKIGPFEGSVLLALLAAYTVFLVVQARRQSSETAAEYEGELAAGSGLLDRLAARLPGQVVLIVAGLVLLVLGSQWLVAAAIHFARALGVSELVIGLTIVAAGTSMPEVATSLTAALRGERDIAVGNVVGSNTFNLLGCLGLTALVAPDGLPVAPSIYTFDAWVMLAVAVACLPVFLTGRTIERWEGAVFLGYYVAYAAYLILAAQDHDALPEFSAATLYFVVPLTVVTLLVAVTAELRARARA